ncbi:hypothetical protein CHINAEXTREME_16045 [Halobiforma lacisalsi AJ5]|uniref:Uncharacterized protein n=1 Tax=Natronobacterium lacisalsi AJ5 TaxID=358396 RepID=M0LFJ4_NATLA|nr:hypothetical protein [Halobiforma lacisalsi]APW99189.1 hypothetical protein CHINAEXTREME_16045 [Halobiforma lacisalsi AJ5]EMA30755.1 hypothetical protein C445_15641 [Halobiforma lacisalsi AJ5]
MTGERSSEDDAEPTSTSTPAADGGGGYQPEPDPERVEFLREIADDVRGETGESKQLANILYRTSDLYDEDEDTTPEEIVRNVKFILEVTEQGGLGR